MARWRDCARWEGTASALPPPPAGEGGEGEAIGTEQAASPSLPSPASGGGGNAGACFDEFTAAASRRDGGLRHRRLVARQILLELGAADAADDLGPLLLGLREHVLGGELADEGLGQVLAERVLEFEVAGEIDRRAHHLEVLLDRVDAFLR